jgi:hypothetical protein
LKRDVMAVKAMEITSSLSPTKERAVCERPTVYFPGGAPSWRSRSSWRTCGWCDGEVVEGLRVAEALN